MTQLLTEEELAKLRPRRKFVLDLEAEAKSKNVTIKDVVDPRGKYYDEYGRTRMWGTAHHEVGSIAVLMAIAEREWSTDRALHSMASTSARSMQTRRAHLPSSKVWA